jgi:hypothetical protein
MADNALPEEVRALVLRHLATMDHVAVLLEMRADPDGVHDASTMAPVARVSESVAHGVLADLSAARLIVPSGGGYKYGPGSALEQSVDLLANMYDTRPVTLVRAIYDRPAGAARSFADAFRIRKSEG